MKITHILSDEEMIKTLSKAVAVAEVELDKKDKHMKDLNVELKKSAKNMHSMIIVFFIALFGMFAFSVVMCLMHKKDTDYDKVQNTVQLKLLKLNDKYFTENDKLKNCVAFEYYWKRSKKLGNDYIKNEKIKRLNNVIIEY